MSLRDVAKHTGLPLGTVKTIVSRSGVFRDNEDHRSLFTLPPIRVSLETLPDVPELPPQDVITGDKELDALLWLRAIIGTGQPREIAMALEAAKKIRTPRHQLEQRYRECLRARPSHTLLTEWSSYDLGDLEGLAAKSIEKRHRQAEATARFGDSLFSDTDAEWFCISVLDGLDRDRINASCSAEVAERFAARPDLMPNTLTDCLHEIGYWDQLSWLRHAVSGSGDGPPEASARDWFVFGLLAEIRPRSSDESKAVLRYLIGSNRRNMEEADDILGNLIG